jgi:hypothetical protein
MEMRHPNEVDAEPIRPEWPKFTSMGLEPLERVRERIESLQETLADIEAIGGETIARKTQRMAQELDEFAPAVTFIGQIKSGKTTLVNAMAGRPGLLPADVNPWTSVVTSIHLNMPRPEKSPVASFTFFDSEEWDHLVKHGGRIGELSERTGAEKEMERLQLQIDQMREKTKARLGKKFELLLGQTHHYQHLDDALVQRYVCLGDDFETAEAQDTQGQFADITKSADLFLQGAPQPIPLTLRDTPGMNDTFMMREQITIRSIRDSKICVVVLSAHQALNAVDMGLIRLISNVKSRQVLIFVNRSDELADPSAQIPEIRSSLVRTLADNGGPENPCILFGSAYWANAALAGTLDDLPDASASALENYRASAIAPETEGLDPASALWVLSGVPALCAALSERIEENAAEKALSNVRKRAANMVAGLRASASVVSITANGSELQKKTPDEVRDLLTTIEANANQRLAQAMNTVFTNFGERVDQAHGRFISRALDALLQHLEANGEKKVWSYSADGLRMLLRTAYQVMRRNYQKQASAVFLQTASEMTEAYSAIFDVQQSNFAVAAPSLPEVPPPVTLAQTIVLDVKTSWWKRWWAGRKGYGAFADGFQTLIEAESTKMVNDLKHGQVDEIRGNTVRCMREFLDEQKSVLEDIIAKSNVAIEDLHGLFGVTSNDEREELFEMIFEELDMVDEMTGDAA